MSMDEQRFVIHTEVDIISARMAVREYARNCGMSLKDQACISMAASSLANSLGFGKKGVITGCEIFIEYFENQPRRGVRVRCVKRYLQHDGPDTLQKMESSRWLVDDIKIKSVTSDRIEVVITKLDSLYKG